MIREETRKNIYNFEAPPPEEAWEHIAAVLDGEKNSPKLRIIPVWVKYAAALLLVAATAITWYQLSRPELPGSNIATGSRNDVPENSGITLPPPPDATQDSRIGERNTAGTRHFTPIASGANTEAHPSYQPSPSYVTHAVNIRPGTPVSASELELRLNRKAEPDPMNENYIYLTTGNGDQVRVSRKLAAAVLAELGLVESQPSSYETRLLSEKMRTWKSRLAESSFVPSPGNMLDLLSLMEVLDEN